MVQLAMDISLEPTFDASLDAESSMMTYMAMRFNKVRLAFLITDRMRLWLPK